MTSEDSPPTSNRTFPVPLLSQILSSYYNTTQFLAPHVETLQTHLWHHFETFKDVLAHLRAFYTYSRKYQKTIIVSIILGVLSTKYLTNLSKMAWKSRENRKYSLLAKGGIKRHANPNALSSMDWYSEPLFGAAKGMNASMYHRSRVRIGSEAFLRKYPNDTLNFLARLYILVRYRWIEWVKRVEWWFVGGWGLIASIGMFGVGASTAERQREVGPDASPGDLSPPNQDPTVATLHKIPDPAKSKDRAIQDEVLNMLDTHFEQRMNSVSWMQKMNDLLRGDPSEQVIIGGGDMAAGAGQTLPVMNQSMRLPQMMGQPGSAHMGNFRMRRMR